MDTVSVAVAPFAVLQINESPVGRILSPTFVVDVVLPQLFVFAGPQSSPPELLPLLEPLPELLLVEPLPEPLPELLLVEPLPEPLPELLLVEPLPEPLPELLLVEPLPEPLPELLQWSRYPSRCRSYC